GARVEYLPPYSPDFNPIEMLIGTNTFKNWFTKCCYCTN
ncbi:MAG: transposase, partial [Hormoscilla sp. GM102CHS1]|nr:transposase [Hormoscilla sp. GM102CHS1]